MGQESELKRKQEMQQKYLQVAREKRVKLQAKQQEQFREKQKEIFSNKQVDKDLFQSQKACEQLDKAKVRHIGSMSPENIHTRIEELTTHPHNHPTTLCFLFCKRVKIFSGIILNGLCQCR